MLFTTLFASALAVSGVAAHPGASRNMLQKRAFDGTATYYTDFSQAGSCGDHLTAEDMIVALNAEQYGSVIYKGDQCGRTVTISALGKTKSGVRIADYCPDCGHGSLDLTPGLARFFADDYERRGVFPISWWFDGEGPSEPQPAAETTPDAQPTTTSADSESTSPAQSQIGNNFNAGSPPESTSAEASSTGAPTPSTEASSTYAPTPSTEVAPTPASTTSASATPSSTRKCRRKRAARA